MVKPSLCNKFVVIPELVTSMFQLMNGHLLKIYKLPKASQTSTSFQYLPFQKRIFNFVQLNKKLHKCYDPTKYRIAWNKRIYTLKQKVQRLRPLDSFGAIVKQTVICTVIMRYIHLLTLVLWKYNFLASNLKFFISIKQFELGHECKNRFQCHGGDVIWPI